MTDKPASLNEAARNASFVAKHLTELKDSLREAQEASNAARAVLALILGGEQIPKRDLIKAVDTCLCSVKFALGNAQETAFSLEEGPASGLG